MANTTRGFSRRTFLLGVGGGAASVSIVWGVSELALPLLGPGEEALTAGTLDFLRGVRRLAVNDRGQG